MLISSKIYLRKYILLKDKLKISFSTDIEYICNSSETGYITNKHIFLNNEHVWHYVNVSFRYYLLQYCCFSLHLQVTVHLHMIELLIQKNIKKRHFHFHEIVSKILNPDISTDLYKMLDKVILNNCVDSK